MKNNKKGFTLVELLAVMIVLAVIALIAVPVVLNLIDDAKENTNMNNAYSLVESAKLYYADNLTTGNIPFNTDVLGDLHLSGKKPESGFVYFNEEGAVAVGVIFDSKCYTKGFDDKKVSLNSDLSKCSGVAVLDVGDNFDDMD